jgi:hypothetical protein
MYVTIFRIMYISNIIVYIKMYIVMYIRVNVKIYRIMYILYFIMYSTMYIEYRNMGLTVPYPLSLPLGACVHVWTNEAALLHIPGTC